MKKKFCMFVNIPGSDPYEEVVEFPDDTTPKEINEAFTEWVFGFLDTAIIDLED